ncbi:hypothetical protein H0H92_004318 [Tricholoma furcatifolium]|nr:hypothetical protein H0H92_004318 [Tricholoma furcatifolium]
MAPFLQAIDVKASSKHGDYMCYAGEIDPEWVVGAIPNGGYVLALLVDACIQHQSASNHRDPIHVTAHFLRPSAPSKFEIRVRTLRTGRGFTNLTAELHQKGSLIITTHQIFGINSSSSPDPKYTPGLTLSPPSSYARRIPIYTHPSTAVTRPGRKVWKFDRYVSLTPDPSILAKNEPDHPNRTTAASVGGEGLEWGAWLTFSNECDKITSTSLAFLVDIFTNMPSLLPPSERPGLGSSWYPTIVLSVEFKAPIPSPSTMHADRTVGLYSSGKFLNDGRHDAYVEVWTAPCNIGEGKEVPGWREKQGTMNVSTQQIFGTNSAAPQDSKQRQGLSLAPPSAYARRIPLYSHPSTALVRPGRGAIAQFTKYFDLAPDPSILEKNASDHPNRTNSSTVGGEGLEWGAWFSFQDGDEITKTSIPLLVDIFAGIPFLMPPSERPGFTGVQ